MFLKFGGFWQLFWLQSYCLTRVGGKCPDSHIYQLLESTATIWLFTAGWNIHTVMIKNVDTTSHDISWHHNWYNLMNVSISLEVLGNCFDCKVVVLQEWVENVQIHRFISFLNQLLPFGCLQQGEHSHSHDKECWHYISDISWHYNWYNLILI